MPNKAHEKVLDLVVTAAQMEGKKIIRLNRRIPDAIIVYSKPNGEIQIEVVDAMRMQPKTKPENITWEAKMKIQDYKALGFDKINLIPFYDYEPTPRVKKVARRLEDDTRVAV